MGEGHSILNYYLLPHPAAYTVGRPKEPHNTYREERERGVRRLEERTTGYLSNPRREKQVAAQMPSRLGKPRAVSTHKDHWGPS